ncbi:MAG: MFS transporter [Gammaproteobacteria bacterium]|nr:MFS transporter [Gammaproteobacteria bacterium]
MLGPKPLIFYCGLLLTLSAFSIDIMLPVFAAIGRDLPASATAVKMTVPCYLFAFGLGQIVFGALSDRAGRRMAIIAGLGVYLAGTLACALAFNAESLLGGRLLQGLGGAAGPVVARAVIRDLYRGRQLARSMAAATAVFSLGPMLAPLLGYALGAAAGWRSVFAAMFAFGGALLWVAVFNLRDTARVRVADAMQPAAMRRRTRRFFACRQSRYFFAVGAWMTVSMHLYLTNSPALYRDNFGIEGLWFALLFASHGLGIIAGQVANRTLIGRYGTVTASAVAAALLTAAAAALLALALAGAAGVASFTLLVFGFAVGFLVVISNAAALAIDEHGSMAGFASSIVGCGAFTIGAAGAALLTLLTGGALLAWAAVTLGVCGVALGALLRWRREMRVGDGAGGD